MVQAVAVAYGEQAGWHVGTSSDVPHKWCMELEPRHAPPRAGAEHAAAAAAAARAEERASGQARGAAALEAERVAARAAEAARMSELRGRLAEAHAR
jgi:hypothetical protein